MSQLIQYRECARKIPYRSRKVAKIHASQARRRGIDLHAYQCRFCGLFHIGHPRG